MAHENRLRGAERIRGELLKLGIRVGKRTVHRHMRSERSPRPNGQTWATCLHHHAAAVWACAFLPVIDLRVRALVAFVSVARGARRVVHVGVTRHPTDASVAQQWREATPVGTSPRFLIHDNDSKVGAQVARAAASSRSAGLRTPVRAPRAKALCARFLGSVRRACLAHLFILHERQLSRVLRAYCAYVNRARPPHGIGQAIPEASGVAAMPPATTAIVSVPLWGGLPHDYRRAA